MPILGHNAAGQKLPVLVVPPQKRTHNWFIFGSYSVHFGSFVWRAILVIVLAFWGPVGARIWLNLKTNPFPHDSSDLGTLSAEPACFEGTVG